MSEIILLFLIFLVVVLAIACFFFYRQISENQARLHNLEQHVKWHAQSISGLTAGTIGVDKRLRSLQQSEKELAQRQDSFEAQNLPDMPYEQAIRSVQQGADVDQLIDEYGLSESEASLIFQLHGTK